MPTYVYETTNPDKPVRRFEVTQSMKDEALRVDPETGEPVRRVISGGFGVLVPGGSTGPSVGSVGSHGGGCGSGCGCH
jgi:predicted nucleic acid-binding Zn ribbon protein